jgi:HK97 family phage major capsid protein
VKRLWSTPEFAQTPTDKNAIAYMKETTFTNASAMVAEGGTKPESTLVFDAVTDPVQKVAHWIPATTEILEDVPSLQAYIDTRLRQGLELTEEDQLLNGDGTAPNISGILDRSGLATDQARGADTNADAILKQITAIETATSMPVDGIIMHPTNWQTIQLSKSADGQYYGDGPFASPQRPTLWGRPIAVTTAVALNTAVVGAFKTAARIFRRGGVKVHVSNSHSDFFIKNLVAILAEERLALAVYRPAAFGKVTGLN